MKSRVSSTNLRLQSVLNSSFTPDNVPLIEPDAIQIDETSLLGSGGYANVFKGTWGAIEVAIKLLKTTDVPEKALKSLREESRKHYALNHPNIVTLYGIYLGPEQYCLVLAKMSCSLRGWLKNNRPLSLAEIYTIGQGTIDAICYLHANGIIFRDLKSSNILLDPAQGFHPCIADFGSSEMIDEIKTPEPVPRSETFVVRGSPRWMAPELFMNRPCSRRTDIFSFGVVLWEMFARRIPFPDTTNQDIIRRVRAGEREPIVAGTPDAYADLIQACEAHKPKNRPRSARLVATLFRQLKPREIVFEMSQSPIDSVDSNSIIKNCAISSIEIEGAHKSSL